jgi:hypothetical protein
MARIKFKKGLQSKFLNSCFNLSGLNWIKIAIKIGISQRTLSDWRREKYTMSQKALEKLVKLSGKYLKIPQYIVLPDYWSIEKAAKIGGKVTAEKYGGPGTPEGRKKGGKISQKKRKLFPELYSNCNLRKIISIPRKSSALAEFIGIFLGDGGISNDFQITISFNKMNGQDYHKKVEKLIENLFGIKSVVYKLSSPTSKNVIRLIVSSVGLVEFLEKNKIKKGNKVRNQVDVPNWIKKNVKYSKNCLRGLVDTDGGVYYHQHSNGKWKSFNIGLCFTNKSKPLLDFIEKTLISTGFHPKRSWSGDNIFIYREAEVFRYEREIGFTNIYQKKRLLEYLKIKKRKGARVV